MTRKLLKLSIEQAVALYEKATGDKISERFDKISERFSSPLFSEEEREELIREIAREMNAVAKAKSLPAAVKILERADYGEAEETVRKVWGLLGRTVSQTCEFCGRTHQCKGLKPKRGEP